MSEKAKASQCDVKKGFLTQVIPEGVSEWVSEFLHVSQKQLEASSGPFKEALPMHSIAVSQQHTCQFSFLPI